MNWQDDQDFHRLLNERRRILARLSSGSQEDDILEEMAKRKNPAAVALGRLRAKTLTEEERRKGGKAGGPARAEALTAKRRREIARKAAAARWKGKGAK